MPRGSKSKYSSKQKRQAHHIEDSARKRGYSEERAEQIGWATVNKQDGGGKKGGRGSRKSKSSSSRGKSSSRSKSSSRGKSRRSSSSRGRSRSKR